MMRDEEVKIYDRLQQALAIDTMRLDEELVAMPQLIEDVGESTASAIFWRDVCKQALDVEIAKAAHYIREIGQSGGKKPPEDQIKTEVMLDKSVIEAMTTYEDAKYTLARWQALSDALKTKASSIKVICELVISGYLTPNAIHERRRQEINDRRGRTDGKE